MLHAKSRSKTNGKIKRGLTCKADCKDYDTSKCEKDGQAGGSICGNTVLETGEACDDGNVVSNDGCSAQCASEGENPPPPANPASGGGCSLNPMATGFHPMLVLLFLGMIGGWIKRFMLLRK